MATIEITQENLDSTLRENEIVFLDFWADWCMPCRQFAPVFEEASEKYSDIVFGKIDTEAQQELAAAANVTSIPTVMVFRDEIMLFAQAGALTLSAIDSLVEQVKALDMDEVRAAVAEQSNTQG